MLSTTRYRPRYRRLLPLARQSQNVGRWVLFWPALETSETRETLSRFHNANISLPPILIRRV